MDKAKASTSTAAAPGRKSEKREGKEDEEPEIFELPKDGRYDDDIPGLVEFADGSEEWMVEKVIGRKLVGGVVYYRVKWWGWTNKYNTWEPIHDMKNSKSAIKEFEKRLKRELKELNSNNNKVTPTQKSAIQEEMAEKNEQSSEIDLSCIKIELNDEDVVGSNADEEKDFACDTGLGQCAATDEESASTLKNKTAGDGTTSDEESDVYIIESEDEDDDELDDPEFIQAEKIKWGNAFPLVRYKWKSEEEPLCILGSAYFIDTKYHIIRIKSAQDPTNVLDDPYRGVTRNNVVIMASKVFRYAYPQMLIKFYEKNTNFLINTKSEEEQAECAARNGMINYFQKIGYNVNYHRMLEDNMPPDQRLSEKELGKLYKRNAVCHKSKKKEDEQCLTPRDENGKILYNIVKDDYGLPYYYGDEVEKDSGGSDSDSNSDDQVEEHIPEPLKKPRAKNRPAYEKIQTRPFLLICRPNLPGIDRLCYRRLKE